MNTIKGSGGEGEIGYTEYSYPLQAHYPVVYVENRAGYYVQPTQYNVAVALTQARIIGCNKTAPATRAAPGEQLPDPEPRRGLHLQGPADLPALVVLLHDHPGRQADQRMTVAKRQTLADFLSYSLCTGQRQAGPYGYSPLPLNLVKAAFGQLEKLGPAAQGGRRVKGVNIKNPSANLADLQQPDLRQGQPGGEPSGPGGAAAAGLPESDATRRAATARWRRDERQSTRARSTPAPGRRPTAPGTASTPTAAPPDGTAAPARWRAAGDHRRRHDDHADGTLTTVATTPTATELAAQRVRHTIWGWSAVFELLADRSAPWPLRRVGPPAEGRPMTASPGPGRGGRPWPSLAATWSRCRPSSTGAGHRRGLHRDVRRPRLGRLVVGHRAARSAVLRRGRCDQHHELLPPAVDKHTDMQDHERIKVTWSGRTPRRAARSTRTARPGCRRSTRSCSWSAAASTRRTTPVGTCREARSGHARDLLDQHLLPAHQLRRARAGHLAAGRRRGGDKHRASPGYRRRRRPGRLQRQRHLRLPHHAVPSRRRNAVSPAARRQSMPPEATVNSVSIPNEVYAFTDPKAGARSSSRCAPRSTTPRSAAPRPCRAPSRSSRSTASTAPTPTPTAACNAAGTSRPGKVNPGSGAPGRGRTGVLVVGVELGATGPGAARLLRRPPACAPCAKAGKPVPFYGSELLDQTALQWAPAYCLNKKRFNWQDNVMPDEAAFALMESGEAAAAEVSARRRTTAPSATRRRRPPAGRSRSTSTGPTTPVSRCRSSSTPSCSPSC